MLPSRARDPGVSSWQRRLPTVSSIQPSPSSLKATSAQASANSGATHSVRIAGNPPPGSPDGTPFVLAPRRLTSGIALDPTKRV